MENLFPSNRNDYSFDICVAIRVVNVVCVALRYNKIFRRIFSLLEYNFSARIKCIRSRIHAQRGFLSFDDKTKININMHDNTVIALKIIKSKENACKNDFISSFLGSYFLAKV